MKLPPRILISCLIIVTLFSAPSCSLLADARLVHRGDEEATLHLLWPCEGPIHAAGVVPQHHDVGVGALGQLQGQIRQLEARPQTGVQEGGEQQY